jgi:hypothetical protein
VQGTFEEITMRRVSLLLIGAAAATSCTDASLAPSPAQIARSQAHFQELTAGKVAEAPINCLPHYRANDMVVIDENTIAFKDGARVYVAHMNGPCTNIGGAGGYALLTRTTGTPGLCRGDIAQVVDTSAHITVGSCSFEEFIPYVPAHG